MKTYRQLKDAIAKMSGKVRDFAAGSQRNKRLIKIGKLAVQVERQALIMEQLGGHRSYRGIEKPCDEIEMKAISDNAKKYCKAIHDLHSEVMSFIKCGTDLT